MFAGSLLIEAEALLKEGLHAADVIKGYEICLEKTIELMQGYTAWTIDDVKDEAQVKKAIKTAICSKQLDLCDKLSDLIAKAVTQVTRALGKDQKFDLDNVKIIFIFIFYLN